MTPRDAVLATSFAPYASETVTLTNAARARGAKIVSITDSVFSPIAPTADVLLEIVEANFEGVPRYGRDDGAGHDADRGGGGRRGENGLGNVTAGGDQAGAASTSASPAPMTCWSKSMIDPVIRPLSALGQKRDGPGGLVGLQKPAERPLPLGLRQPAVPRPVIGLHDPVFARRIHPPYGKAVDAYPVVHDAVRDVFLVSVISAPFEAL